MVRILAIFILIGIAFMLVKYRANQKLQKGVVVTLVTILAIYTTVVVISELLH